MYGLRRCAMNFTSSVARFEVVCVICSSVYLQNKLSRKSAKEPKSKIWILEENKKIKYINVIAETYSELSSAKNYKNIEICMLYTLLHYYGKLYYKLLISEKNYQKWKCVHGILYSITVVQDIMTLHLCLKREL